MIVINPHEIVRSWGYTNSIKKRAHVEEKQITD